MGDEQYLLMQKAYLLTLEIELQSMVAENKQREYNNRPMAYTAADFEGLWANANSTFENIRNR